MIVRVVLIAACWFIVQALFAQEMKQNNGELKRQDAGFGSPLEIPLSLSANFGEIRPNHYHMGLDIRTAQRENLPVVAAADGYVSRISIEAGGFGNAIYITHPNGYTTLYAHLNSYYPQLAEYVKTKQYKEEKWEQDFKLPAGRFPVRKGQFIAFSGNTGASAGPHLHFEIRDTKTETNLNPLLLGIDVPDNIPPALSGLYWYDRRYSVYDAGPKAISLKKSGSDYSSNGVIKVSSPKISFAMKAQDKTNSSGFYFGVYKGEVYMDEKLAGKFALDRISYDETRYVNAGIDYKTFTERGSGIQYLFRLPGNHLQAFLNEPDGTLNISDEQLHNIRIVLTDAAGNVTHVNLLIQYNKSNDESMMFTADRIPFNPNKENHFETGNVKMMMNSNALYDVVPFRIMETAGDISTNAQVGSINIPVHNFYTASLKLNEDAKVNRDKVVMFLKGYKYTGVVKGKWTGNWMEGQFRNFGVIKLVEDNVAPVIKPLGWKSNTVFGNNSIIRVRCDDNLETIKSFRAEVDGNWLLFARRGDEFIYKMDEHFPGGRSQLKLTAEDVAGNKKEIIYDVSKSDRVINTALKKTGKKRIVPKTKKHNSVKRRK
ncbi:MAG: family metallopeptidase [Chitinophagaceae bacterium]|nr:family metallopeptidase [Chitinophagaceae bacterium]